MRDSEKRCSRYQQAVTKAVTWLAAHQGVDGSFGLSKEGIRPTMVTPIAFLVGGRPECALASLQYVKREHLLPDGRFTALPEDEDSPQISQYPYQPSWVIISAQLNGCFDISYPAIKHILDFQDMRSGGLFGRASDRDRQSGIIDLPSTSMGGLVFLHTGHLEPARRVGDYVLDLLAMQPEPRQRLYTTYHTESGLLTEVAGLPRRVNAPLVVGTEQSIVANGWLLGLLIAFLSELYGATGRSEYLKGALGVFQISAYSPDIGTSPTAHKYAWGCAKLHLATGEDEHLEAGCRVADYLAGIQEADGSWLYHGLYTSLAQQGFAVTVNITSQFSAWIAMVLISLWRS